MSVEALTSEQKLELERLKHEKRGIEQAGLK